MTRFVEALRQAFGDRVQPGELLAPLTTFKIGGPADVLVTLDRADELKRAVMLARDQGVPVTVIGGGSNLLILSLIHI